MGCSIFADFRRRNKFHLLHFDVGIENDSYVISKEEVHVLHFLLAGEKKLCETIEVFS